MLASVRLGELRRPQARPALRRPAPAGRAGPGAGQPAQGAAARRAARRARPQAARGDAGRAEDDPARGRHHVRVRHPRPGRGALDERPRSPCSTTAASSRSARRARSTSTRPAAFVAGFVGTSNVLARDAGRAAPRPGAAAHRPARAASASCRRGQPVADGDVAVRRHRAATCSTSAPTAGTRRPRRRQLADRHAPRPGPRRRAGHARPARPAGLAASTHAPRCREPVPPPTP